MPKFIAVTIITVLLAVPGASASLVDVHAVSGEGATALASTHADRIAVGGRPYFPVMALDLCTAADVEHARAAGIRMFVSDRCESSSPADQLALVQAGDLAVLPVGAGDIRGDALAGWTFPDEREQRLDAR
jgi:hypothetical protein